MNGQTLRKEIEITLKIVRKNYVCFSKNDMWCFDQNYKAKIWGWEYYFHRSEETDDKKKGITQSIPSWPKMAPASRNCESMHHAKRKLQNPFYDL